MPSVFLRERRQRMKRFFCMATLFASFLLQCKAQTAAIELGLTVSNSQGKSRQIVFGLDPAATANIDTALGENELPPLPPQGIFDARFISSELPQVDLGQGSYRDLRQGDVSFSGTIEYELHYQTASRDSILIHWDLPDSITGAVEDVFGGSVIQKQITGQGQLVIDNPSIIDKLKLIVEYKALPLTPAQPELLQPAVEAGDVELFPQLIWGKAEFAETYNVQCYLVQDSLQEILSQTGIIDTVVTLPQLQPQMTYEWRVQSENMVLKSDWSVRRFITAGAVPQSPETPVALNPAAGENDVSLSPQLVWKSQKNTETFDLQVYFAGSFSQLVFDKDAISDTVFEITGLQSGALYFWRLRAVNAAGKSEWSDLIQFKTSRVNSVGGKFAGHELRLYRNYPNPFNPSTRIEFSLDKARFVSLKIYDLRGRLITTLVDDFLMPGEYDAIWQAGELASGKYFAIFQADNFRFSQSLTLLK